MTRESDISTVAEWEDSIVYSLKFKSRTITTQPRIPCSTNTHACKIHASGHLEVVYWNKRVGAGQRVGWGRGRKKALAADVVWCTPWFQCAWQWDRSLAAALISWPGEYEGQKQLLPGKGTSLPTSPPQQSWVGAAEKLKTTQWF